MNIEVVNENRVRLAFYRIKNEGIKIASISELLSYTRAEKLQPVPEIFLNTSTSPSVKKLSSEINHYIKTQND